MTAYIELLETEIKAQVREEIADGEITFEKEQELHVLFENCKHAKDFLACMMETEHTAR